MAGARPLAPWRWIGVPLLQCLILTVLFSLPFILFSAWAGWLADRLPKNRMVVWSKIMELAAMLSQIGCAAMPAALVPRSPSCRRGPRSSSAQARVLTRCTWQRSAGR